MFQQNTLIGRVANPTTRKSAQGNVFLTFSLATQEGRDDHTEWFNCSISGKFAEVMADKIEKGQLVFVQSKAKTNKGNDGKFYTTHWVDNLRILASPQNSAQQSANGNYGQDPDMPF